jgi:AcrR family transcriptional regulator
MTSYPLHVLRQPKATAKAEETRERILDAALTLFREKGFDETTMRDVAGAAGVATGAAYYYFRSKHDLVMAFYVRTADDARDALPAAIAQTKDLRAGIRTIIDFKFEQFANHRRLMAALLKAGVDPRDELSPFGQETKALRDEHIDFFRQALEHSGTKVPKDIAPYLPRLLWMYQMGLIFFWITDESSAQAKTRRLLDGTLDLVVQLIKLGWLPLLAPVRKRVVQLLRDVEA